MSIKFFEIERKGEVRIKVQAGSRRGYNLGGGSRLKERGRFGLKYRLVVEGVTSWGWFKIERKGEVWIEVQAVIVEKVTTWGRFKIERKGEVWIEVQAGSRRGYNLGAVQD